MRGDFAILKLVERSNMDVLRDSVSVLDGIDMAPLIRKLLASDLAGLPREQVATYAAYINLHDPNVEIDVSANDIPDAKVFHGLEGMREM